MRNLANRLQLKDFRLISAIEETGQLALAAERLSLTQPAASRMLARIERGVGVTLFDRHPKGMIPTPVGAVLISGAIEFLNGLDHAIREAGAVGSGRTGSARVGAVTGGAVGFVVPAVRELKRTATGADIYVDVAPSDALMNGLLRGEFDFVLSRMPAGLDPRQFKIVRGRPEIVRFLVRRGHPLARGRALRIRDLEGFEWVIQAARTPMRQAVEEGFIAKGAALPSEIVNTTSLSVMIAYLSTSDAIAPVSREVADLMDRDMSSGGIAAIDLAESIVISPYHLITRKNQPMSPLALRLQELVRRALAGEKEG